MFVAKGFVRPGQTKAASGRNCLPQGNREHASLKADWLCCCFAALGKDSAESALQLLFRVFNHARRPADYPTNKCSPFHLSLVSCLLSLLSSLFPLLSPRLFLQLRHSFTQGEIIPLSCCQTLSNTLVGCRYPFVHLLVYALSEAKPARALAPHLTAVSMDSPSDSVFDDDGASSDFVPEAPKPKAKAVKKTAATASKTKAPAKNTTKASAKPKAAPKSAAAAAFKKKAKVDTEDEFSEIDRSATLDDASVLSATPPNAAASNKGKKAAGSKKSAANPLSNVENESFGTDGVAAPTDSSERYQKLTQLEHIIKRPDTYIGSIERSTSQMWVYNSESEAMEYREVSYVPGLYKIFDEILVNAADNKHNDKNMDEIRVTLNRESGEISVWNNGRGIPIEIHAKEKLYIPELIFGHLLTSSNYNDMQQKVTGGRNGYGAKLCNIFSTEFTIETADSRQNKKYKQTWTNNMSKMGKAKITDCKGQDYTKVTFTPDFKKFGMEGVDDDFEALVKRRVYDMAGTCKVIVKLNGSRIPVRNFKQYMAMYTNAIKKERGEEAAKDKTEILLDNPDPRWEVGFAVSDGSFQQVSFVNSIATTSGGSHVNAVADQICNRLAETVKKRNKTGASLKPAQIRNHIFVFVNSQIVNPAFTSQTKEQLTTKPSQFGSKIVLSEEFLKKVIKTQVMENIMHFAEKKADQILKKSDGNRRSRMNNPKLTDANKAGTKEGHHCTLILTEGDSAKGLAMAGRAIVGPDLFGVFPLRGKMLNVRDASVDQISKNAEIQNIKNFLGLQHKKEYTDTKGLRYGHLMIMTDQDHDGSHIKGLLINFLQVAFPSLLKIPQFLIEFITPIVKVWKGDPKNPIISKSFFTMQEYETWKEIHGHDRRWEKKYYKGLGTSTTEDAEIYFQDLDKHLKQFHVMQDNEAQLIDLAFSKKKADERKEWLRQFKPGTFLDHTTEEITYTDFINKELILFSMADNIRSIPSVVDGLKPGQRKVLYTCFKRNVRKDIKVVELAGYVSGMTAYQHGDVSLQQTIVGLAQTFVGSNNVNCLEPSGNFGSRLQGGSDSASARYIYTRLSPFARRIFHPADEPLLTYNVDDGHTIEPEIYVPVVPLVLINGADGIGTGWSTSIPNYNPEDIVANLKCLMDGEPLVPMQPWFRGFTGEVVSLGGERYKFSGRISQVGENEVEITELPIRCWTQDFKDRLEEIIKAEKVPSFIKDYKDYNTHTKVHFVIQLDEKHAAKAIAEGLEEKFKLSKTIATSNLVAFDPEGRITKYDSPEDILREFYSVRIKFYEKRKQYQLSQLQRDLDKLSNQARFIQMIIDGKLVISKKPKAKLIQELKEKGFKAFSKISDAAKSGETAPVVEEDDNEEKSDSDDAELGADSYDYLFAMPLWSLTQERVEKLRRQIGEKEIEVDNLIKLSKEDIWRKDLDDFIAEWKFQLEDEGRRRAKSAKSVRRVSSKLKTAVKGPKKRKAANDDDSDFDLPKTKKSSKATTVNRSKPQGNLLSYLSKPAPNPKPAQGVGADDASDLDEGKPERPPLRKPRAAASKAARLVELDGLSDFDEFEPEVMPAQKSRAASPALKPADTVNVDKPGKLSDLEVVAPSKKSDPQALKQEWSVSDESDFVEPKPAPLPGKRTPRIAAPPPKKVPLNDRDDSDVEIISRTPQRQAKANRKPITFDDSTGSDSDNDVDLLGDVSQMVKGIGGTADPLSESRTLFSELSRPGTSAGSKPTTRTPKAVNTDFDPDETDYSKLIPQNSPRRSLLVKPKDSKHSNDEDEDNEVEEVALSKPVTSKSIASKAKAGTAKPAAKTNKASASTTQSKGKKVAAKHTAAPAKKTVLSPAAKAYAAKKAKAKMLAGGLSDDDIDAMANDILDSPTVRKHNDSDASDDLVAPVASRKANPPARGGRPARRAATMARKPTYVIEDDSNEDEGEDDFDDGSSDEFADID
ncbi:DNA topoisomerase 2 [Paracoccidioides brasiliensis]|nr:DNA topoisomerase 2 [Paracoccidioides brasiliensis]